MSQLDMQIKQWGIQLHVVRQTVSIAECLFVSDTTLARKTKRKAAQLIHPLWFVWQSKIIDSTRTMERECLTNVLLKQTHILKAQKRRKKGKTHA